MTKTFLPKDYESPKQSSKYLKLEEWDTKIRIISDAITGWVDWYEKKPVRTKTKPETNVDDAKPAKHFRAFVIWNYNLECLQVVEFTQRSIQNQIMAYYEDEDFGDPKGYDLKINKSGKDLDTKYQIKALGKSEVVPEIMEEYLTAGIDLEQLFEGGDPFGK